MLARNCPRADVLRTHLRVDRHTPALRLGVEHDPPLLLTRYGVQRIPPRLDAHARYTRAERDVNRSRLIRAHAPRLPIRHQLPHDLATILMWSPVAHLHGSTLHR